MANWLDRLAGSTRAELLTLLRRSRQSINSLAGRLGISDNAVRMHVSALQRDGLVETAGVERQTGGKPAQLFQITREAEELFPKAYSVVLGELVQTLEEEQGREATVELLRRVGVRAGAGRRVEGMQPEQRVEVAADALRSLGADVEVQRTETGWLIRGHGCPLSAVVGEHAEVCRLAEALVQEVAGQAVVECCDRTQRPRCAFSISGPGAEEPTGAPAG